MHLRFLLIPFLLFFLVSCGCDKSYELKTITTYSDGAFSLRFTSQERQRRVSFMETRAVKYKDRSGKFVIRSSDFNSLKYVPENDDWGLLYMKYISDGRPKERCLGKVTNKEIHHLKANHPDVFTEK